MKTVTLNAATTATVVLTGGDTYLVRQIPAPAEWVGPAVATLRWLEETPDSVPRKTADAVWEFLQDNFAIPDTDAYLSICVETEDGKPGVMWADEESGEEFVHLL